MATYVGDHILVPLRQRGLAARTIVYVDPAPGRRTGLTLVKGMPMLVRQILDETEPFPTIVTDVSVRDAAEVMRANDVRAVPVVEGDKLVGIVTDWDLVDAFATEGDSLAARPVSAIMTSEGLHTIDVTETAADATSKLREYRVHHLPVLEDGRYVGMICLGLEWSDDGMLAPPVRPALTARRP